MNRPLFHRDLRALQRNCSGGELEWKAVLRGVQGRRFGPVPGSHSNSSACVPHLSMRTRSRTGHEIDRHGPDRRYPGDVNRTGQAVADPRMAENCLACRGRFIFPVHCNCSLAAPPAVPLSLIPAGITCISTCSNCRPDISSVMPSGVIFFSTSPRRSSS